MHPTIDELLNRWEECIERGERPEPSELCRDHPELLEEFMWQVNALQAVDAQFGGSAIANHSQQLRNASSKLHQTIEIATEFHIDRLHAAGGLGEVYLASDPLLNRTVAIKFPRAERLSADQLARFEREAQVTGKLNHPGIVPVHALKQDAAGQPCYVMRFVDGPTLQDRIEQLFTQPLGSNSDLYSSLGFRQLLQSFASLCNIVAYAHDSGIVHRDIKPANVILGPFGETMLMDWGLAKVLGETEAIAFDTIASASADTVVERALKTRAGQFMGTPAYASPEQRQGQIDLMDARTDIYSLGATLFTLLTGSLPTHNVASSHVVRNRLGPVVPSRLVAIYRKATAEEIDQRYASVSHLREDIERYLAGEPISVVAETLWSRLSRTVRRRSGWAAALLVGVSMTIVAGAVGSFVLNQKNQELRTSNKNLEIATTKSIASQQRSAATTELLTRAMRAATPDMARGKEPTVRQLLDETSLQLRTDRSIHEQVAADTHQVLADAYLSLGDYEIAQHHADLASEKHRLISGENSPEALYAQATQASLLSRRDQDDQALIVARDALERGRAVKELDAETLSLLIDVNAHVRSVAPSPNHAEIVALHREALDLATEKLGPTHRQTLRMSTNLAVALIDSGKPSEAEPLLIATHKAHESLLGESHPETLVDTFNLVQLLRVKGDVQSAIDLCRKQRPLFEEVLGLDHQRTIRLGLLMAQLEFALQNPAGAEREARIGLERAARSLGEVHQQTLEARGMLCGALLALGKVDEAESLALEQYNTTQQAFGDSHKQTIMAVTLLFDIAEGKGDLKSMAQWFEKLRGSPWEEAAQAALKKAKDAQTR